MRQKSKSEITASIHMLDLVFCSLYFSKSSRGFRMWMWQKSESWIAVSNLYSQGHNLISLFPFLRDLRILRASDWEMPFLWTWEMLLLLLEAMILTDSVSIKNCCPFFCSFAFHHRGLYELQDFGRRVTCLSFRDSVVSSFIWQGFVDSPFLPEEGIRTSCTGSRNGILYWKQEAYETRVQIIKKMTEYGCINSISGWLVRVCLQSLQGMLCSITEAFSVA